MRAANQVGQQTVGTVLDTALLPDSHCDDITAPAQNQTACRSNVWARATGDSQQLDGTPGLRSTAFGLLAGAEDEFAGAVHLGMEAGVGRINGNDALGGSGHIDTAHAGLYAYGNLGSLVLSVTASAGMANYHVQRSTGIGQSATQPDGTTYAGGAQVAWPLQSGAWTITPKAGALYQHQRLDGFSETLPNSNPLASAYAIHGEQSTYSTLQPYAGVDVSSSFQAGGVMYLPQFTVGYRYDTHQGLPSVRATSQDGTEFTLAGNPAGRGTVTVGARIHAQIDATLKVYVDYSGAFAQHLHDNALTLGVSKQF